MEILFHDTDLLVCIKPVGYDSERQVPALLSEALGGDFFTVHRLDKNVGGIMVYARNSATAARLSKAIQNGEMTKEYLALVHGTPDEAGVMEDILFKDSSKNKVYVVKRERKGTKNAKLEYNVIRAGETSLVHIRLHTGRSHQIRVQFASRGYPLVGDHKYGARDQYTVPFLFSSRITFPHRDKLLTFEATPEWK